MLQGLLQNGQLEELILRLEQLLAAPDAKVLPPHLEASPAEVLRSVPPMVWALHELSGVLEPERVQYAQELLGRLSVRMARLREAATPP